VTGFAYLLSIVAILWVVRWLAKIENSDDPRKAMQNGIIGLKEYEEPKVKATRKARAPWDSVRD
jgi:hypothetical protein